MRALPRRITPVLAGAVLMLLLVSGASYAATGSPNPMQVFVTNTADDPVPVGGTVQVGNLPATQAVSGRVSVDNLPATQDISGTVSVDNLPATQAVTGTVGIDPDANTVSVDLSDAQIETTPADTAVLLDEVVTLESDCGFLCGPAPTFVRWLEFPAAQAERVHLMAYGANVSCESGQQCLEVTVHSVTPSLRQFSLGELTVGSFSGDAQLLEVPGTTIGLEIVYGTEHIGDEIHLYAVGR